MLRHHNKHVHKNTPRPSEQAAPVTPEHLRLLGRAVGSVAAAAADGRLSPEWKTESTSQLVTIVRSVSEPDKKLVINPDGQSDWVLLSQHRINNGARRLGDRTEWEGHKFWTSIGAELATYDTYRLGPGIETEHPGNAPLAHDERMAMLTDKDCLELAQELGHIAGVQLETL